MASKLIMTDLDFLLLFCHSFPNIINHFFLWFYLITFCFGIFLFQCSQLIELFLCFQAKLCFLFCFHLLEPFSNWFAWMYVGSYCAFIIPDKLSLCLSDSWEADNNNGSFADSTFYLFPGRCSNSRFPYIILNLSKLFRRGVILKSYIHHSECCWWNLL